MYTARLNPSLTHPTTFTASRKPSTSPESSLPSEIVTLDSDRTVPSWTGKPNKVEFDDRPANQPVNRFAGQDPVPDRPQDPLPSWRTGAFERKGIIMEANPEVAWKAKDVFNPSAIVKDGKVYMIYRAEDDTGRGEWNGTSRLGLAVSEDGLNFRPAVDPDKPILEPTEPYELPGGCEDPRVVQLDNGQYVMTYTAFDGKMARLALAVSDDLVHWEKKGLVFSDEEVLANPVIDGSPWTKAGAIVPEKINGEYVMYFGEGRIFMATSEDGVHWKHDPDAKPVIEPRPGFFDQGLVEPGPTPWVNEEGIHLIYNGDAPPHGYQVGEVVFDKNDPGRVVRRSEAPFLKPEADYEITGQVGNVIFAEGFVEHGDQAILYYGAADGKIAAATAPRDNGPTWNLAG